MVVGLVLVVHLETDADTREYEMESGTEVLSWLGCLAIFEIFEYALDQVVYYMGLNARQIKAKGYHLQKSFILIDYSRRTFFSYSDGI